MYRNSTRIQRVLAEKNYNNDHNLNYEDYGFSSESELMKKTAQVQALYNHGIAKEAFVGALWNAAKTAYTAGGGTVAGGLGNVAKTGWEAVKNPVANTWAQGANAAKSAGTSEIMGGAKALASGAWSNPYGQAAMISGGIGAATGALGPVGEGESRLGNIAKGALGGAATGVAFQGATQGLTSLGNKYLASGAAATPAASTTAFQNV